MRKNSLVICDRDEKYCKKLDGFLRDYLSVPFEIFEYTDAKYLKTFENKKDALLIISERLFEKDVIASFRNVLVLKEMPLGVSEKENNFGISEDVNLHYTGKYQSGEKILESILSMCLDMPGVIVTGNRAGVGRKMKLIGLYTPIKSILQTRTALELAKQLSQYERCIFITNDPYCCESEIRAGEIDENISDLMYYAECEPDKFSIYLEKIAKKLSRLDYLPSSDGQIREAQAADYLRLIGKINESGKYDAMIFDIAEQMRSITEIFNVCDILIVLTCSDNYSEDKLSVFTKELENTDGFDFEKLMKIDISKKGELIKSVQKEIQKEKDIAKG